MAIAVKTTLLLAATLLVGSGAFRYWIAPRAATLNPVRGAWLGAVLLISASIADLHGTLAAVVGSVDMELLWRYVTSTRHGDAVLVRLIAVSVLVALLGWRGRPWLQWPFVPAALVLLGTFSYTSHAAAMAGTLPLRADLLHFAAASS